jgi:hypothetical protein
MPNNRVKFEIYSTRGLQDGCFMPVAWGAEEAFARLTGARIVTGWVPSRRRRSKLGRLMARVRDVIGASCFRGIVSEKSKGDVVLFLMGLSKDVLPLLNDSSRRKWLYLFDTWEPGWQVTEDVLRGATSLQCVYMPSSQSVEHFRGRLQCDVQWLPQAGIGSEFSVKGLGWGQKTKTILNIGRTNHVLDEFFLRFSQKHGFRYLRDEYPGQVLFKTRDAFLSALDQSQIIVVHPRNLEYPEVTGRVSMLTARNFEAYQSAGVVCGFKPDSGEFERVFDGFPFVEYSASFESDLLAAVQQPQVWADASRRCLREHTWDCRLGAMAAEIKGRQ